MFDRFFQKPIIGDPTKFSLREETLDLKPKHNDRFTYFDKKTGEKFYKILRESGPYQKLVSLMLKGIVNVSDVIKIGDDYYSHKQNFGRIDSRKENIVPEIEADLVILQWVFLDGDHGYSTDEEDYEYLEKNSSVAEHQNLLVDQKNKRFSFFDFGSNSLDVDYKIPAAKEFLQRKEIFFLKSLMELAQHPNVISILKNKVKILMDAYPDNDFETFQKIIQRSGVQLSKQEQKTLFSEIKSRLQVLDKILLELENKK
ncbi:MAG TPA: hypothetical protein VGO63_03890 [Candidatus Paceibacterota bacterium]|jgi:hypothetical protein|nr:hypothetical protein [Candidatus Paceibacterota bacterium]